MTTKSTGPKAKTTTTAKSSTKAKTRRPLAATTAKTQRPATGKKSATAGVPKTKAEKPNMAPAVRIEPGRDSKQARLIALLHKSTGATIEQMMTLTGWQAHTVRGTISAVLRKKLGLNVTSERPADSGARCYRITGA